MLPSSINSYARWSGSFLVLLDGVSRECILVSNSSLAAISFPSRLEFIHSGLFISITICCRLRRATNINPVFPERTASGLFSLNSSQSAPP